MGVIDLMDGSAVHAVAGRRDEYRPVPFCDGDPSRLVLHYQQLGIESFYVADLDAICGRKLDFRAIETLASAADAEVVVDCGWSGRESQADLRTIKQLSNRCQSIRWVAATESVLRVESLRMLTDVVSPHRTLLGLDYRAGQLLLAVEQLGSEQLGSEQDWIAAAAELGCVGAVVLDLAAVGTSGGPATLDACRQVKAMWPHALIYSGGGIRSADDVRRLQEAGCDHCLVATALHPSS